MTNNTKYLYINTIGCQMNVYDSERIARLMRPMGYEQTEVVQDADLIVLNTCAIREKAEQKAFSFLGRMPELKRKKPELIIAVGGCVAQQEGRNILKRVPYLDIVFGTQALGRLPQIIEQVAKRRCRVVDVDMIEGIEEVEMVGPMPANTNINRFVTIMQGCDNFCTYCVVPFVRGREASREPNHIISEIKALTKIGVREITLLGQNVNSYGKKEGLCSFAELLRKINDIEDLARIRFTTSHPKDLSLELMAAFRDLDKLCSHIHLPVQSGSNAVLKRMNRKYTREHYLDKIEQLRGFCPEIAITSDMIVGFPKESEQDFEQTLSLMRTVEYDSLFAFMYSDRPNAPAASFSEKIPEPVKKERLQKLLNLQEYYTLEKNKALKGSVQEILVEGLSKQQEDEQNTPQWSGRTPGNKIVNFAINNVSEDLTGKLINVKIETAFFHSLRGSLV